ncbi:5-deoxy-glucuronate isomerase [Streptomyces sp. 2A115]|uniref:5-deoxy-glucuronate isomerase n=1 Tax=Streptomyces sp. 2A115 TaxID=3457439 RepID=UPI003FD1FD08
MSKYHLPTAPPYFDIATPNENAHDGFAHQRVYGTQNRPIDVLAEVRSDDAVLIPHGCHFNLSTSS